MKPTDPKALFDNVVRNITDVTGHRPKRTGDSVMTRCPVPAHDDRNPSLSVKIGDRIDGVVLKCFNNCTPEAVTAAVGLTMSDLYVADETTTWTTPAVTTLSKPPSPPATYPYHDQDGELVGEVRRTIENGKKDFRPWRADGEIGGFGKHLYRLPQTIQAIRDGRHIFIVEGEKDVDRLASLGLAATTNIGGEGQGWRDEYTPRFAGANVVILPDNDKAGHKHAHDVATALDPVAATVKMVRLDPLPPKGDVSDWLDNGHGRDDLVAAVKAADEWDPNDESCPDDQDSQDEADDLDILWTERELLGHIRQLAEHRRASPWAVLGAALVHASMQIDHDIVLPPLVGGAASLNLFAALVGQSGAGKGAALKVARELLPRPVHTVNVGSGEGIVDQFAYTETYETDLIHEATGQPVLDDDGKPRVDRRTRVVFMRRAALFDAAEVDSLDALKGRSASTLGPTLRQAFMSERIGFAYRTKGKDVHLPEHSYRLGLTVGVQPGRGAALLDEADGGTPQRFMWLPTTNPDAPDDRPGHPGQIRWTPPGIPHGTAKIGPDNLRPLHIHDDVAAEVDRTHLARHRGQTDDPLGGHRGLLRLKIAAVFGMLDGRFGIDPDDWRLAETVLAKSDETRHEVERHLAAEADRRAEAAGRRQGIAKVAETATVGLAVRAVEDRIVGLLADRETWTRGQLIRKLSASQREHFVDAAGRLVADGIVDLHEDEYHGQPRRRYALADENDE